MNTRRNFLYQAGLMSAIALARAEPSDDPFASLPAEVWRNSRRNGLVMIRHPAPAGIGPHAKIVAAGEPGDPLVVAGQVIAPDGRTPAAGVTVYAYNTDAKGYYCENNAEYPPRIYGWMKTDSEGRFELATIMPGRYPGMRIPSHVHFSAWGAGYPPQWIPELRFEGDSYLTAEMLEKDRGMGEFREIQPVKVVDGVRRCSFRFRLQMVSNFRGV
jgi:protocatechuate 3,4-dioxygenase beta subunit